MAQRPVTLESTGVDPKTGAREVWQADINASFTQTYADMNQGFADVQDSLADGGRIADTLFGEPNTENFTTAFKTKLEGVATGATNTPLQTSVTDATSGRALRVGGFGVGAIVPSDVADIDVTGLQTGVYRCTGALGTFPPGNEASINFGGLFNISISTDSFRQIYCPATEDEIWARRYRQIDGGFQEWKALHNPTPRMEQIDPPSRTFVLSNTPMEGDSVLVYYDGVLQPAMTVTGSFIQMANGVSGVSEVWVHYWHF